MKAVLFGLSLLFAYGRAQLLIISTTYQAEDVGVITSEHPQCKAWMLWWKTQNTVVDLTEEDIDHLAYRRSRVSIRNERDAEKYHLPLDLLQNYTEIYVDFENVCRLHPRVLKIASAIAAERYHLSKEVLCYPNGTSKLLLPAKEPATDTEGEKVQQWLESGKNFIRINDSRKSAEIGIHLDPRLFEIHESVMIFPDTICKPSNSSDTSEQLQYYAEKYGALAFDIAPLDATIEQLMEPYKNPNHLDLILKRFDGNDISSRRPFPSTHLIPFLKHVKYDSRTPPVLFVGEKVTVKIGLHIQAMSNFELSTMDYAVDTWLRMAWYDPRLRHGLSRPVLVNEFKFLKKIWRPDPIFRNAKQARFHKVTYLNFYMFIFPGGEIFMDIRVYLKPTAAKIVLCKYPHDRPVCSLRISSLGFTADSVEFEWFSHKDDAIQLHRDLEIPELTLIAVEANKCDGMRKSGNYSCLEAQFLMQRELGYHIAQTYIPTMICVVFSWISPWLPEEFVEGRIFVSLTVFLTLSAESNSAKEELPKVSYIKAIDIWFGFTSTFVFLTMLQALLVIYLEHYSKSLRRRCENNLDEFSNYKIMYMMQRSRRYHHLARECDAFCKKQIVKCVLLTDNPLESKETKKQGEIKGNEQVMYPVVFVLFLIIYGFVIIQGEENKCVS